MSAEIINSDGTLITARISQKLTEAELSALHGEIGEIIQQQGRVRILVLLEHFSGWREEDNWEDLSFQLEHDQHIEKMAIVCERKWKELALLFTGQNIRKFPIKYFEPSEKSQALSWLAETAGVTQGKR